MPRPLQSPLLVGRDDQLALAERRTKEAASGRGSFLLLAGEAGIGKTRLLRSIVRSARLAGFRAEGGALAPQDSLVPLASIRDLGRSMRPEAFDDLGPRLLGIHAPRGGDSLASRRVLVREVAETIVDAMDRPTLLAFEDLQWADELTLEVLGEIARLAVERPLITVATYRIDELPTGSIHREWRSRLLTQRQAEELRLERLDRDQTALVATLILGTGLPVSREVADAVYGRTNGIPLHIEELLGALGDQVSSDGRSIRDAAVPDTIEDAVLARTARLSDAARAVARAASVMGRCFVPEVLAGIMDRPIADLDTPLQELVDNAVLYPFDFVDLGFFDFRHQLLRDALYGTVPAAELRRLHARAGEFGADLVGANEIHASLHFERAGLRAQAFRTALAGARAAAGMSSRSEAFELYRRAVANMPTDTPPAEKAAVYQGYLDAAAAVDSIPAMEEAARSARRHFEEAGDALGAARALGDLSIVARRDARPRRERIAILEQVEAELSTVPPSPRRSLVLGQLRCDQGLVALDVGHVAEAEARFAEARSLLIEGGDSDRDVDAFEAAARVARGDVQAGLDRMMDVARSARETRMESTGVSAFRFAAALSVRAMEYGRATVGLAEGLRYADEIEQSYCRSIMAAASALSDWGTGRWDDAVRTAELELVAPGSRRGILSARNALAFVAFGRGHFDRARQLLDASLAVGRPTGEAELILPALWGLAETAWLAGDPARALDHCDEALELAIQVREGPLLVPFLVTGVRSALGDRRPEAAQRWFDQVTARLRNWSDVAVPAVAHAEGLLRTSAGSLVAARGALEKAISGWDAKGRAWEGAWARLDLATCLLRSSRYVDAARLTAGAAEIAARLGSRPLEDRASEIQHQARGRGSEEEPWYPLTAREFEVAKQIATGMTNAQIAAELFVSPKTVSAHVEHILAKLGASRRTEVATWVASLASATPAGIA